MPPLFMEQDGLSIKLVRETRNQQYMDLVLTMTGKTATPNPKQSYLAYFEHSSIFAIKSGVFIFV